ncbi:hypothetical protein KHC23_10910 [Ancylobacter dichloromethanicus]|uniref:Uncharacterized protein n=1 Tax=Ancylobacter dichloromethanicus TaxID=518825 RepID=A0A9W6MYM4_9HYPH|nr:hypothetical protein [Ancylobacter dichloromethanicus]MBS7554158.1 hypothetical protein [Ancylobacter dichloromethanicus]GLK71278.1 hypothetical protein GCM10017643_13930 [Ancylobacter dichloromethanicus]
MKIILTANDAVLLRFGTRLSALGATETKAVMKSALWRGGNLARTQVKRALVKQTGIKYGLIDKAMQTKFRDTPHLLYELEATGDETNLNLFGAIQRKKGVSARPWNQRRTFKGSFFAYNGRVYRRLTEKRGPIKPLYGPNIGRELVKDYSLRAWEAFPPSLVKRVEHEIQRRIKG